MLIGISGKTCAGKDFLSAILCQHKCREINLDKIGHLALEQKQTEVLQVFPELQELQTAQERINSAAQPESSACSPNNVKKTIDRKKLGDLVFRNPAALHKLEEILHPHMKTLVLQELNKYSNEDQIVSGEHTKQMDVQATASTNFILNAAILEKLELLPLCQIVLWLKAPLYLRAKRAWQRDHSSLRNFLRRNWAQRSLRPPRSNTPPIFTISNNAIRPDKALTDITQQLRKIPQILNILEDR